MVGNCTNYILLPFLPGLVLVRSLPLVLHPLWPVSQYNQSKPVKIW